MYAVAAALERSIPERVARAWALLCGEQRRFEWNPPGFVPTLCPRAYLMALDFIGSEVKAGVAILLCESDAHTLAQAMFKLPLEELTPHDVDDACLEVCNVLADSLSDAIAPKDRLHTRLPQPLEVNGYQQLLMRGALQCSLRIASEGDSSHFLVFNPLNPNFETRPAPL